MMDESQSIYGVGSSRPPAPQVFNYSTGTDAIPRLVGVRDAVHRHLELVAEIALLDISEGIKRHIIQWTNTQTELVLMRLVGGGNARQT